jgi:glucokinase
VLRHCVIAGDIGGSNTRVALVADDFRILSKLREPSGGDPFAVLLRLIEKSLAGIPRGFTVCGMGLAVAGIVDKVSGRVLRSPNIQSLSGFSLRDEVMNNFGLQVFVENDANAAAYGEKIVGAAGDFEDFVMLTLGTGIGSGIVTGGRLLPFAAEVGHSTINMVESSLCSCGNSGCLESYASATAIIRKAISALEKDSDSILKGVHNGNSYKISAEDIYNAALEGDVLARTLLCDAGKTLGIGIANMINIFSPQAVILTGGLIGAWNIYIEAAMAEAAKRSLPELYERVQIIASSLGDNAGTIGMAALVLEKQKNRRAKKN